MCRFSQQCEFPIGIAFIRIQDGKTEVVFNEERFIDVFGVKAAERLAERLQWAAQEHREESKTESPY